MNQAAPGDRRSPEMDLRVFFAAQRTMLAWVRTGVALMGFGFVVARFGLFLRELAVARQLAAHQELGNGPRLTVSVWAGISLLVVGVAVMAVAAVRYRSFARDYERSITPRAPAIRTEMALAGILAAIGIVLALYLATMPS